MQRPLSFLSLGLLLLLVPGARPADDLSTRIDAFISGPDYKAARWGILVVDADTGKTVYEHNPDQLMVPASVTKLYSCSAALLALGANHRFETPVYWRGKRTAGRLDGDLILVAQGDLTFGGRTDRDGKMQFRDNDHIYTGSTNTKVELTDTDPLAGLNDLARQVKAAGILRVEGDVLVDDRLFVKARGSGSGPDVLSPMIVNDNLLDVIVTPGSAPGEPATARMHPRTATMQMDVQVTTVPSGQLPRIDVESAGPQRFVVRGQIALGSNPLVRIYPVDDPAGFARALFIEALRREGLVVRASPLQTPQASLPDRDAYPKLERAALFTSPPFAEVVKVTLKVSHNLYASTMPLLIAAKNGKRTLGEGLRIQRRLLADLGVNVETIAFAGGAGGANADSVTARTTVQLLRAMNKRPEWAAIQAGLPVLGLDGTLAESVGKESPARGKVFAKTGTLNWTDLMNDRQILRSKSVAGVMTTATGRPLVFAIFVNDVPLPPGVTTTREGKALGRLCEILYESVP